MKHSTNSDAQAAVERHPLPPFLPEGARLLMLGSFPPQRRRWSMEFFYPNLQNDMWRIMGLLAAGDKNHFLAPGGRQFDRGRIEAFCRERGLALYDTAEEVVRLRDNASGSEERTSELQSHSFSSYAVCSLLETSRQRSPS